jgi:hypothetical protein
MSGTTIFGARVARDVWVCGPGAFVALKALALEGRVSEKDAYDLYYVVRNYGSGIGDVAARLRAVLGEPEAEKILKILKSDFSDIKGLGPIGVARFLSRGRRRNLDEQVQADVVGSVQRLVQICESQPRRGRRTTRK